MVTARVNDMDIKILLENGVYTMGRKSGTGKTYLSQLCEEVTIKSDSDEVWYSYTPWDIVRGMEFRPGNARVVVVDRYDTFHSEEFDRKIEEAGKQAVVLVDLKRSYDCTLQAKRASVEYRNGKLVVM